MRLTSDFWVSAIVRRVFEMGGFAAIEKRGSAEAGAIYVIVRTRSGELMLYGPAPQTSYDEAKPSDRLFAEVARSTDAAEILSRLEREKRFDPDLWVVEIEAEEAAARELLNVKVP